MELSLRVPDGLRAADKPVRLALEPGAEAETVLHAEAIPGAPVPGSRCYPMGLIVRRFNCGDIRSGVPPALYIAGAQPLAAERQGSALPRDAGAVPGGICRRGVCGRGNADGTV